MTLDYFYDTADFTAFPEPETYFHSEIEKEYLLPIATIKHGGDIVLIAAPVEPEEGIIGEYSQDFYNETCRENWVSYSLVDGKWKLDCDSRFFQKGNPKYMSKSWYPETTSYYNLAKSFYKDNEFLQYGLKSSTKPDQEYKVPLFHLGGIAEKNSNWYNSSNFHHKLSFNAEFQKEEVVILDQNNVEYEYLGYFSSYYYMYPQAGVILVFFHPIKKQVLLTYDYT